jgi:aryl-alcohol dehydrogenase-like predicted oxidoreductase
MRTTTLGPLADVSRLTLGGGGLGGVWGPTDRAEAMATIRRAVDEGINLIDLAPIYGDSLAIVAEAFGGPPPSHVRFTSKVLLGTPAPGEACTKLVNSLDESLRALRLERIDVFFLHSNICPDGYVYGSGASRQSQFATLWSVYENEVVPTLVKLKSDGRIGAWGITGVGTPKCIDQALQHAARPDVIQLVSNLLDSAGGMRRYSEPHRPREAMALAKTRGVGVMGIRAVQAGALTRQLDRDVDKDGAEARDYLRAAPFRALCDKLGEDPADIAHRYALTMPNVDTVVLGVKNRAELDAALNLERAGPLSAETLSKIDGLLLRGEGLA